MSLIEQIAKKEGCSKTTVRRVLRGGNKEVWAGAAERAVRIRQIAHELGFLSNASAAAVKNGRFNAILLVLSTERGRCYLPESLLHALCSALYNAGQHLVIGRFSDDVLTSPASLPTFLSRWSCDGALVNYTDRFPPQINTLLEQYHIPSIWINAPFETDCVQYDERRAGREAARILLKCGRTNLRYVDLRHDWKEPAHYSAMDRPAGFIEALREAGSPLSEPLNLGHLEACEQIAHLAQLLRSRDRPDGIVTFDRVERILMAAERANVAIPESLSVMTFVDGQADLADMPVMQMTLPCVEAAEQAVKLLLNKISNGGSITKQPPLPLFCHIPPCLATPRSFSPSLPPEETGQEHERTHSKCFGKGIRQSRPAAPRRRTSPHEVPTPPET